MIQSTIPQMDLIECSTCHKKIALLAATCVHCGAPNDWIHPSIEEFLRKVDEIPTSRPFNFDHSNIEIWGSSDSLLTTWAWLINLLFILAIMASAALFGLSIWVLFVAVIGGVLIFALRTTSTFRADLKAHTWESTDDQFWKPVRDVLKL